MNDVVHPQGDHHELTESQQFVCPNAAKKEPWTISKTPITHNLLLLNIKNYLYTMNIE
jgi:hypothetical protein